MIRFLNANGVKEAEIQHEIYEVYKENIVSDEMEQKWNRAFKDGHTNVHDVEQRWTMIMPVHTWLIKLNTPTGHLAAKNLIILRTVPI